MVTLGAEGYNPDTDCGYLIVVINALFGVLIVGSTINTILRKVTR